jgi:hypothetical protein
MARKERSSWTSKKKRLKMNSEIQTTISKANLESCLTDSWLMGLMPLPADTEFGEVILDIPETITITLKPKEVAN